VLAFGSNAEAHARLEHFVKEASQWEGIAHPKISAMSADVEQSELGRFQLTRQGRLVFLDVGINGRRYKDLLRTWSRRECWDWGE
jgi:hypothetical protein